MRRSPSRLSLLVVVAASAASCVSANDPGVAVDTIEADVVFGIEEAPEPVLPANTNAGPVPAEAIEAGFDVVELEFRNPAAGRIPSLVTVPKENRCPAAPPTAAAERPADVVITGEMEEGVYVWKRDGTQTVHGAGEPVTTRITGFEKRIVRNVQPYDDPFDENAYTFEMVQALIDRPVVQVRTYLVKPETAAQVAPGGAMVVDEPRANDPEGGVSLLRIEEFSEDGEPLGSFEPTNGLLLLGLPVDPAETFQSSATDPKTGQSIVQEATVRGRARVDACGELVDGWRVEAQQVRSDVSGTVDYNYVVATQYGGMPILEEISTVGDDGTELNLTLSLGQLHPDPLPEAQP